MGLGSCHEPRSGDFDSTNHGSRVIGQNVNKVVIALLNSCYIRKIIFNNVCNFIHCFSYNYLTSYHTVMVTNVLETLKLEMYRL